MKDVLTEPVCLLSQTKGLFGEAGDNPRLSAGYTMEIDEVESRDRSTGQIILQCQVAGCNTELEVYPNPHYRGKYDVEQASLRTGRFVCARSRYGNEPSEASLTMTTAPESVPQPGRALDSPIEMSQQLVSAMAMDSQNTVSFVAIEAGRRSGQPGDREAAAQYRKLADRALAWLSEKGVI